MECLSGIGHSWLYFIFSVLVVSAHVSVRTAEPESLMTSRCWLGFGRGRIQAQVELQVLCSLPRPTVSVKTQLSSLSSVGWHHPPTTTFSRIVGVNVCHFTTALRLYPEEKLKEPLFCSTAAKRTCHVLLPVKTWQQPGPARQSAQPRFCSTSKDDTLHPKLL